MSALKANPPFPTVKGASTSNCFNAGLCRITHALRSMRTTTFGRLSLSLAQASWPTAAAKLESTKNMQPRFSSVLPPNPLETLAPLRYINLIFAFCSLKDYIERIFARGRDDQQALPGEGNHGRLQKNRVEICGLRDFCSAVHGGGRNTGSPDRRENARNGRCCTKCSQNQCGQTGAELSDSLWITDD